MVEERSINSTKVFLIIVVCILLTFGLCMLYSTSGIDWRKEGPVIDNNSLIKQMTFIAIGGCCAVFLHYFDYRTLCRMSRIFMGVIAFLLLYLALANILNKNLPMVRSIKGAYRWIRFGSLSIQPSEFAKIAIILFMADYYHRFNRHSGSFVRGFLIPCIPVGIIGVLIIAGGSLSVTMITGAMVVGLLFVCGVRMRYLAFIGLLGVGLLLWLLKFRQKG